VYSPIYLTIVIARTEIILCNPIISVQIFEPNIFSIKNSLYLTVANIISAEIMNENNCLKNKMMLGRVAWQTTFTARKHTLKPTHPPLACLPKQGLNIAYFELVIANVMMKMLHLPFGYRTNKSPVSIFTLGKSLIDTDFECPPSNYRPPSSLECLQLQKTPYHLGRMQTHC
jgi:hypothetical protein